MTEASTVRSGRRERHAREKRERILAAAGELFGEHGFDGVTTQQIAERADVAVGTLFRYAATKGELFLMVYNEQLARGIAAGAAAADGETDTASAVLALVRPVLVGTRDPASAAAYQRELLFGAPGERYRAEGLALVDDLQSRIAERLARAAPRPDDPAVELAARRAAHAVFAALNLLLVRTLADPEPDEPPVVELRAQVELIVRGFLVTVSGPEPAG